MALGRFEESDGGASSDGWGPKSIEGFWGEALGTRRDTGGRHWSSSGYRERRGRHDGQCGFDCCGSGWLYEEGGVGRGKGEWQPEAMQLRAMDL